MELWALKERQPFGILGQVFQQIEAALEQAVQKALADKFQIHQEVGLEQPKQSAFGELAIPVAFQLARQLRKAPRQIAEELVAALPSVPGIASLEIAGNGFINVRFDRPYYAASLLQSDKGERALRPGKIVVEHTNINPNKAAHIGHLRNAVLGDTFVRMLRHRHHQVEVQNYIDNTGVQVADVVVGFHFLEKKTAAEVKQLVANSSIRFDYLCWDLYARTSAYYETNPDARTWRAETLHEIEAGGGELAALGSIIADAIVRLHLQTMKRLDVTYQLLPRESEILYLNFWGTAFELLKQRQAVYLESEGKNKGCWVMPSASFRGEEGEDEPSKVIVRSNGTVTYVGKDIAYQLWKFGLLGSDFYYRPWDESGTWVTTTVPFEGGPAPAFGHADQVFNVIDSRQSYLQDVVVAGLRALDFAKQAEASTHFSYEMVALTPRTCLEMGITLSEEDRRRAYVEVSGRKGLGVKADDLIDKLIETARAEVQDRHEDKSDEENALVARHIAIGALRYFMLKFTRTSVIAFDFHEALSFEGETGPYVQYAAVRAGNILKKATERGFKTIADRTAEVSQEHLQPESIWQLLLLGSKLDAAVERAIHSGEPAHVAKYAFQLAQSFNNFYHEQPVLTEENEERRGVLLWVTDYTRRQLTLALSVLGIELPSYM